MDVAETIFDAQLGDYRQYDYNTAPTSLLPAPTMASSSSRSEGNGDMDTAEVPPALAERLGDDAVEGLLSLLAIMHQQWTADMTTAAVERFEHRLTEEISGVRQSITQADCGLRQSLTQVDYALRQSISQVDSGLRQSITQVDSGLRQAIAQSEATLRREVVEGDARLLDSFRQVRVDVLKWSIALWMGQVVALAGIMALMLRLLRP